MPSNAQIASPTFDLTIDTAELSPRASRRLRLVEEAWSQATLTEIEYATRRAEILAGRGSDR